MKQLEFSAHTLRTIPSLTIRGGDLASVVRLFRLLKLKRRKIWLWFSGGRLHLDVAGEGFSIPATGYWPGAVTISPKALNWIGPGKLPDLVSLRIHDRMVSIGGPRVSCVWHRWRRQSTGRK